MEKRRFIIIMALLLALVALSWGVDHGIAQEANSKLDQALKHHGKVTPTERKAAAENAAALGLQLGVAVTAPGPGGIPDYFGQANWAYSPLPTGAVTAIIVDTVGSGYTAPNVNILDVYGTGSGATASATVDLVVGSPTFGQITAITVNTGGSGYSAPVVTITDATGSGTAATAIMGALTGGIHKFVDSLPGLCGTPGGTNLLGQCIPVANPDIVTYPGSDYYEISLVQYTEQMHSNLSPTRLGGYVQVNNGTNTAVCGGVGQPVCTAANNTIAPTPVHYLGPLIVTRKDIPVRIKFINNLPTGAGGDLFIPVDTTVMGAGMGPLGMAAMPMNYTQNRATLHLHGNNTVWISDGTPHQWITPANETTPYPQGVSVYNVPDMNICGATSDGCQTFYYTNEQSARLMFYHDHSYGITRLNVYAGEAAGYLVTDDVEQDLINGTNLSGVNLTPPVQGLPGIGIPLIIQDKTFVDATTIAAQDPTWNWGTTPGTPNTGDLWYPHVYVPAQNPWDPTGANPFGRWHYAPWFWPPAANLTYGPIPNPYCLPTPPTGCNPLTVYDCSSAPWEPPCMPATPNPSMPGEAFMDTPVVNGTVYPYIELEPKAYRFRILNAANDRFFNLQLYVAADKNTVTLPAIPVLCDGISGALVADCTEVKMVPATVTAGWPANWPTDGRAGGVPDPATKGPDWIQIGTEGGFLPAPVVVPIQPVTWNLNQTAFNFGNVEQHSLLLGTAERVDVIVDFSQYAGKTLILYNDAPAAFPALDPRYDYYTGNPNQMDTGGAPTTQPGYGPNTRTVMQIRVGTTVTTPTTDVTLANLQAVFAKTATKSGVFEKFQDPIIMPQAVYNSAYNASFPGDATHAYIQQQEFSKTFSPIDSTGLLLPPVTIALEPKAIQDEMGEAYDTEYGRMSGLLGLEMPITIAGAQNFMLYPYISPPVEIIKGSVYGTPIAQGDGTQIWKITHNGVDTHTIHTHLFNAQLINRVAWDGALIPPDENELGWKETFRVNPLEHTIIALRPTLPINVPFDVPNSIRPIDVTMPLGAVLPGGPGGFFDPLGNPITVTNHLVNFGWEYVYHCHLLAHEEMDMMHAVAFAVPPKAPTGLAATIKGNKATLTWTDNSLNETSFTVQRATAAGGPWTAIGTVAPATGSGSVVSFQDPGNLKNKTTYYYRVFASNLVGDAVTAGFPTMNLDSAFSSTVTVVR